MSFAVHTRESNGFRQVILEDKTAHAQLTVLPECGGSLHAFIVQTRNGPVNIIDNYPNIETYRKELTTSYKGSKLSPFACRIPGGRYSYNGDTYELKKKIEDGSAIHGLLYEKAFEVVDVFSDDSKVSVQLKYNYKKEDPGFPFKYQCEITYTLFPKNVVQLQSTIINLDDATMPLADGWHPYFKPGGKIDNCELRFNALALLQFNEKLVPTGRLLPYTMFKDQQLIKDMKLDNCFLLNMENKNSACTLFSPSNHLSIEFLPDDTYPYLQIYIPGDRESIAIENLSAAPDSFNNKMGLISLPPLESKTFTLYYKVNIE
jgi:aldose 1-epimerase